MENQRQNFECRTCGQTFGTANELDRHNMRVHKGNRSKTESSEMGIPATGEMKGQEVPEGRQGGDMYE